MFGPTMQPPAAGDIGTDAPEPEEKDNPEQPNFSAPKGFDSHSTKPGASFDCVAKIEVEDDGTLTIVSLDGVPFKDTDGDDEVTATDAADKSGGPPTSGFLNAADNGLNY